MPTEPGDMAVLHEHKQRQSQRSATSAPPMYRVLILNDDYTPMDFVVDVLKKMFNMEQEQAVQVMLKVHYEGKGICGIFPRDIAATKVEQVNQFARMNQHPLQCVMEEHP